MRLFSAIIVIAAAAALQSVSASAKTTDYSGPIIDAHAHLRLGEKDALSKTHPIGTDALRKLDDQTGVSMSALIVIAKRGQIAETRKANDAVIAAAAGAGRFYAVPSVHPLDGADAFKELDRLAGLGVREIKLHPNTQNFDVGDPAVAALVEHAGNLNLVLLFDSYKPWDTSEVGKFLLLAAQFPKTRLVLAHMGFSQFRETIAFATLQKIGMGGNVWFDLSAIGTAYVDSPMKPELLWTIRQIGISQFLFGSDWPVDTPAAAVAAIRHFGFTPAEQRAVFHDNAARLLGLK
ncbi:putative TIM-barrel fold metal-dependent hydrolase [Sphingomonas sp. UYAg733]